LVTDGGELYDLACAGCHRDLEDSQVKGKDADKIQKAIAKDKGGMGPLIALRMEEIQAIADALAQVGGGDDDDDHHDDD
jgi:mono/diheme cytochrome c family protein